MIMKSTTKTSTVVLKSTKINNTKAMNMILIIKTNKSPLTMIYKWENTV